MWSMMASALKSIVSKNRKRLVEDGFNLDLSYISNRIIAMGFPAEKVESIYRNSLDEVKRYLETKHGGHYFIYNLCSERFYDSKRFHGRVAAYPFDDHHPPDFSTIRPFCDDVDRWLSRDERNVAVVHCKAGKGRTGVMICCYLLHCGLYKTAEEVLEFYAKKRTVDSKGVTIPSQKRYINYYATTIRNNLEYKPIQLFLRSIVLDPLPNFFYNFTEFFIQFEVKQASQERKYESRNYVVRRNSKNSRQFQMILDTPLRVCGDVKIKVSFKHKLDLLPNPKSKEFHFWFNTFFVESAFSSDLCHSVAFGDHQHNVQEQCLPQLLHSNEKENGHSNVQQLNQLQASGKSGLDEKQNGSGVVGGFRQPPSLLKPIKPERHSSCVGDDNVAKTVNEEMSLTNLLKHSSISDDHLIQRRCNLDMTQGPGSSSDHRHPTDDNCEVENSSSLSSTSSAVMSTASTTLPSFSDCRTRHSSVPQTAKSPGALPHISHHKVSRGADVQNSSHRHRRPYSQQHPNHVMNTIASVTDYCIPPPMNMPGTPVSMRLDRQQIDKVSKDKTNKYADNFHVLLFLFRPTDQSDAGTYSSSPACKKNISKSSPDDSSSDDDTTDSEMTSAVAINPVPRATAKELEACSSLAPSGSASASLDLANESVTTNSKMSAVSRSEWV